MNSVLIGLSHNQNSHMWLLLGALKLAEENVIMVFLLSVLLSFCIREIIFEYKYIWSDRNTSFSKRSGRYDRVCFSDNFNHKKVIIHRYWYEFSQLTSYQFLIVIERCYIFILFILWTFISFWISWFSFALQE